MRPRRYHPQLQCSSGTPSWVIVPPDSIDGVSHTSEGSPSSLCVTTHFRPLRMQSPMGVGWRPVCEPLCCWSIWSTLPMERDGSHSLSLTRAERMIHDGDRRASRFLAPQVPSLYPITRDPALNIVTFNYSHLQYQSCYVAELKRYILISRKYYYHSEPLITP